MPRIRPRGSRRPRPASAAAPTSPSAPSGGSGFSWLRALLLALALSLLFALVFLVLFATGWGSSEVRIGLVGGVAVLCAALVGLLQSVTNGFRLSEIAFAFAVPVAALVVVSLVLGSEEDSRPVPVTARTRLTDGRSMTQGSTARVTVASGAVRDRLRVTFAAQEAGDASPCIPASALRIWGDDLAQEVTARLRSETVVHLPLDTTAPAITFNVDLETDAHCHVSIDVKEASLRD
ncbi:hypothetical protein [Streptomyces sp. NPDC048248]|uniref:hypothetical protein n=1 Tax=Streptomyces sp. NPDC048248 TaxID=3365523 RepID=UPI003720DCCD